jgi:hypothetical protein
MAKLSDEQRRALGIIARHPDGCVEAVPLAHGFHVGQLAVLVVEGLAEAKLVAVGGGRRGVWMTITEAGRKAIAE